MTVTGGATPVGPSHQVPAPDPAPTRSTSGDRMRARGLFAELAECEPDTVERGRIRDELVEMHLPLVEHLARRFRNRGEPLDDLVQVAHDRADQVRRPLRPRARRGVLDVRHPHDRRRDQTALPRQGLGGPGPPPAAGAALCADEGDRRAVQRLGRSPTVAELAEPSGDAARKRCSRASSRPTPTQPSHSTLPTLATRTLPRSPTRSAPRTRHSKASSTASRSSRCWTQLPPREKRILLLRFFGNMTQSQIAAELGISQMHVSRLLARTLTQLRAGLLADE